jgi:hypothetical protein
MIGGQGKTRIEEQNDYLKIKKEVPMKRFQWMAVCTLAIFLFSAMPVGAFEIGARGYYWFPGFKTDMKADSENLIGSDIDLKDNLNVGTEAFPSVEVFGGLGSHHLALTYTPISYSASTRLAQSITFNDKIFAAGWNVDTDLKLRMLDLEYRYTLFDTENILAGFSVDVIGQIKYIDGEAKMFSPATGPEADFTLQAPVPMVGVGVHAGILLDLLEARAKVTGMGYGNSYIMEGLADLSLTPFPLLDVHAGYKLIRVHVDRKDIYLNSDFSGPYLALTVSF